LEVWKSYWLFSVVGTFIASVYIISTKEGSLIWFRGRVSKNDSFLLLFSALVLNILIVWVFVFIVLEPSNSKQVLILSMGLVFPLGGNKKNPFEDEMNY
jgi:predicted neutral ceramidase superfamily lipid hydrolase